MALDFNTSYRPRRLVSFEARIGSSANWSTVPGVSEVRWRHSTVIYSDTQAVTGTSLEVDQYKYGQPIGIGRTTEGILLCTDPNAIEQLVDNSDLQALGGSSAGININTAAALQIRFKINTGLNTNNFRFVTRQMMPVVFGDSPKSDQWISSNKLPDNGDRVVFPCPFRVMLNQVNTSIWATNSNTPGTLVTYSNS